MTVRNPLVVGSESGTEQQVTEKYWRYIRTDTNNVYADWLRLESTPIYTLEAYTVNFFTTRYRYIITGYIDRYYYGKPGDTLNGKRFWPYTNWKLIPNGSEPSKYADNVSIAGYYEEYDQVVSTKLVKRVYETTSVSGTSTSTTGIFDSLYANWLKTHLIHPMAYYGSTTVGLQDMLYHPPFISEANTTVYSITSTGQISSSRWYAGSDTLYTYLNNGIYFSRFPQLVDTRYKPGSYTSRIDRYSTAAETPNITTVSVAGGHFISGWYATHPDPGWPSIARPAYINSSNELQQMTNADIDDTFVKPFIRKLLQSPYFSPYLVTTSATIHAGTTEDYTMPARPLTSPSLGKSLLDDTRYVIGSSTAANIGPNNAGSSTNIASYRLRRVDSTSNTITDTSLVGVKDNGEIVEDRGGLVTNYPDSMIHGILRRVNYYLNAVSGYRLRYQLSNAAPSSTISGVQAEAYNGSIITDTRLDGTSSYNKRLVNADDYRTQEFPSGSATNNSTHKLWAYIY